MNKKHIKLLHLAFNPEFVLYQDIIIKLAYHIPSVQNPIIEICVNSKQAQDEQWTHYGVPDGMYTSVQFQGKNETQTVQINDRAYSIQFINHTSIQHTYPNNDTEHVLCYEFEIESK